MLAILKNIKSNEIAIFQDALYHYAETLKFIIEKQQQYINTSTIYTKTNIENIITKYQDIYLEHLKYELHISNDLWREFNKKLDKNPQPLNSTIKLTFHLANTLKHALLSYQVELPVTSLNRAIIERLKQPLIQQT